MADPTRTDVLVVGLGIHGSAAAFELAARGVGVVAIDRFEEGHARGSSHGRTRMIRRAYPNPLWNPLVERAFAGWERWEEAGGRTLVHRTGGLYAHRGESQLQGPGTTVLHARDEMTAAMPSFAVPEGYSAVHDPSAGVVEASDALDVAHTGARAGGAELSFGETMLRWEQAGDGVVVETDRRTIHAGRLVLTTGAWVGTVVPELAGLFEVWRILTLTMRPGQDVAAVPRLGAFSVDRPEGLVFGIPDVDGNGFKAGVDAGLVWDPDTAPAPPTDAEIAAIRELVATYVPGIDTEPVEAAACLYTITADKRFVVGALPWAPSVVVGAACSGHGFKFGPAIGEALADLCQDVPRPDLDFIGVARRTPA